MIEYILKNIGGEMLSAEQYSPLTLAYIGDCVYELYVRTYLIKDANHNVNKLHKSATKYVCCKAQAELYRKIENMLTDAELAVYKRGRNTKSHVPKNSEMKDYRIATGVEALIGHLYIKGENERICELLKHIF
ncbi:MAG: ribonuclease III [Clostridiales bacterium]|nr:ribonuclease III [Clostridiales bacterium]